jgi:hypothetical protein
VAFSTTVSSKQPNEVKVYRVDFSPGLDDPWIDVPEMTTGVGLNDLIASGTYFADANADFQVKISTAAAIDKFQWSSDAGVTWSSEIEITGSAQLLENGISITFGAVTGHTANDVWSFTAHCKEKLASVAVAAYEWDLRAQVNREYDLETAYAGADEAEVAIYAAGTLLVRDTIALSPGQRTLFFQAINDLPWIEKTDFLITGSVGWGNVEGDQMVWFRAQGGEDRHSYKVTIRAISTKEKHLEADIIIPVEEA